MRSTHPRHALLIVVAGIHITNDGHAILREIDVSHPAAKVRIVLRVRTGRLRKKECNMNGTADLPPYA